ncbi:MAG: dihydropteroate synthase, partial [Planctomycetota bacterium]
APPRRTLPSGKDVLEVGEEARPVIVGERTNVLGSRKFKRLVRERRFEEAAEVGRAQVKGGAYLLDVCLQDPEADEAADMEAFLLEATKRVRVPFVIDTTDADVMERALRLVQGKCLLNSVNLEEGLARFERVVPLARRYGAALVVGLIDEDPEQGMAVGVERKEEIAARAHDLLTRRFGVPEEDIVFDPLVFPCGTGDEAYRGSARATIEGVRRLKARWPLARTILGISNISFGLPAAGREVLNSVFLQECVRAGLDLAIVNSERIVRYPTIPEAERRLAHALLDGGGPEAVAAFTAFYRRLEPRRPVRPRSLSLAERLQASVIEGSKEGLAEDLDRAVSSPDFPTALDIVNGPLMAGMVEVGRLFNDNQLIVAEVLQSAAVMKAAVTHLEPHMPRGGGARRGRMLLATVKGDVHDIGKNLVDIVFSNNGYEVIDLGIKVPSKRIIEAVCEYRPDLIGLSGLLVKSAHVMVAVAEDLRAAGIDRPLLVGGAALSPAFTYRRIAPAHAGLVAYARDA